MEAKQVPLYEQLEGVPLDARLVIEDSDGMGATILAIGRMCHGAAAALREQLEAERATLNAIRESMYSAMVYHFKGHV